MSKHMYHKVARKLVGELLGRSLTRYEVVHHVDGNPQNNNIVNLQLMSLSDHSRFHMTGRVLPNTTKQKLQKQSRNARPGAKLEPADVRQIRKMLQDNIERWLIAYIFRVHPRAVYDINTGRTWRWLH